MNTCSIHEPSNWMLYARCVHSRLCAFVHCAAAVLLPFVAGKRNRNTGVVVYGCRPKLVLSSFIRWVYDTGDAGAHQSSGLAVVPVIYLPRLYNYNAGYP